ncbi:uncharacterized protein [Littorina saxatilis]|uniref:uncharacterized protein isoform X3 n=1 Tax=Littorina saxatilis TaxID=31220 RepID=UPI0038B608EC
MGVFQQLYLLLKKNVLLRRRHPGLLLLEVVWPILIVAIIALIRIAVPPIERTTCHYQERAMPSAGVMPFLQTFVCNLDNKCNSEDSRQTAQQTAASVSALVQQITPYLGDEGTLDMLDNVDQGVDLINSFNNLFKDDSLMKDLDNATSLARYFRDPDKLKRMLVTDYNFTHQAVDALMDSQANITKILELSGYPDLKGVTCNPRQLSQFLILPKGTNVTELSRTLCDINDTKIADLTYFLQTQLNVAEVVRLLGIFEKLKERLNIPYTLAQGLTDVADMLDLLLSIDIGDLTSAVKELADIKGLPDIIRNIPAWIEKLIASGSAVEPLGGFISAMDPIVSQIFPNNSMWMSLKHGFMLGSYITDLVTGNTSSSNATTEKFMQTAGAFLQDIGKVFNELSPEVKQMLDAFSTVNWPRMWNLLSNLESANDTSVMVGLHELENVLKQTSLWGDVNRYVPLATDLLHSANLVLHHTMKMESGIEELKSDGGELKQTINMLLEKGPNVTLAVLKAFTHPDTIAVMLADGQRYSDVCNDVIEDIRASVGQTTADELKLTLCSGDMSDAVNSVLQDIGISNISMALNKTITRIASLFMDDLKVGAVSFPALWKEIQFMMQNVQKVGNTTISTWVELFSLKDTLTELMQTHQREWEPVVDMLNVNYVGSSVLALMTAAGNMMNDSDSARWMEANIGPYVHMATMMVKSFYTEMQMMMDTYSTTSPLGQLVYYSTNYAPEIMTALFDMGSNGNMDMVYKLASSADPMAVFCGDHMMQQMGLPNDAAVGMEVVVCQTNWTQVGQQVMSVQTTYTTMVEEMMQAMEDLSTQTISFSLESDWRELSYYTSRVMDMVMLSQDSTGGSANPVMAGMGIPAALTEGPWSLAMQANLSQINVAMEIMMDRMQTLGENNLKMFTKIVALVMENIEQQFESEGNTTRALEWRQLKHYFRIIDDYMLIISSSNPVVTTSLPEAMKLLPDELQHMVQLAADAYLELIDALRKIILHPDQFITNIATKGLKAPDCGNVTVTSFLMLKPSSGFGRLETQVCTANWTDISHKMAQMQQTEAVTKAIEDLTVMMVDLDKLALDPVVNWTQVLDNVVQTLNKSLSQFAGMEQTLSSWDLLPFNMTAINARWADFYKDMEQVQNVDVNSLLAAVEQLQGLLEQEGMEQMPENDLVMRSLMSSMYLNVHIMTFANIQLRHFNSTPEVNLFDWIGSDELRKVAEVLRYSPEINEIGVNTVIRILADPTKLTVVNPMDLCENFTLFSQVFAVDDRVMDTRKLQQTVCNLNISLTVLMEELSQNWEGFSDLVHAFEEVLQTNTTLNVNYAQYAKVQMEYSQLITSLVMHNPTIMLFDNDRWMNVSLYEGPWMKLWDEMQKLYEQYQNPNTVMANMVVYLNAFYANPELKQVLVYLDVVLDMTQRYTTGLSALPQSFAGYPNLGKMYSLMEQLPELTEMVAYTSLNHPEQLNNWGGAMASWETFCSADPRTLMTAPPGGGLDVVDVFGRLCAINVTQLLTELNGYQGLDRFNALIAGGNVSDSVNITALAEKLTTVFSELENTVNTTSLTMNYDLRFVNSSVWNAVFHRLEKDLNQTLEKVMSPEFILQMLNMTSTLFPEFGGFQGTIKQVLAITDIVLDQVLKAMKGGSLQEMFSKYPTVKSVVTLLDHLPEIYATLAYTGLYTPEKLLKNSEALMSFEKFCSTDLNLILTAPPQSGYDLAGWQQTVCSINVTVMLEELAAYQGAMDVSSILLPNSTYTLNLTSISEKLSKVTEEVNRLLSGNGTSMNIDNYFNITAWDRVMDHLQIWMQDAAQRWSSPSFYNQLVSASVLSSLQAIPEVNTALAYTSAILDMVQQQLQSSITSLPDAFAAYPNLNTLLTMLEDAPEIFEIFAYTTLQHQDQLARWAPAMASWETFCSHDPNALLTAPPGSRLSVVDVFTRLCSLNVTEMMIELNQYQGMDKLEAVMSGNMTEPANVTALAERLSGFIHSSQTLFSSPMDSGFNLRVFNQTVWEHVFERLGKDLNGTQQKFMSPEVLMNFYQKLFGGFQELNDTSGTINKAWAITDVILDQMLQSFQGGNLQEMFAQYPTIKSAVGLLDNLPEIYETVMYTALYAPDKVALRIDAFESLETFCTSDMRTVFTVPDGVNFDLLDWKTRFCSLNLTVLMDELAQYQGTKAFENILSPNSSVAVNMTSIIQKIETVVGKLTEMGEGNMTQTSLDARFLNAALWERANSNLEKWASNSTALFWMRTDKIMELYATLDRQFGNMTEGMDFMKPVYSVMGLMAERLLMYENMTSFSLEELFVNAPEMQKLVRIAEEPGVIEVLFQSANSKKFESLLTTNNVTATFVMLCAPSATLDQYLTVPAGVIIDLSTLKTRLCDLDFDLLQQEVMGFLDIERLMAAFNGSLPVDYTKVGQQLNRMSELIVKWAMKPPTFTLPSAWQNESFWLGMLENYAMTRQGPDAILQELESFMDKLGPLLTDDSIRQVVLVAQTVMRLLNQNLAAMQSQNLTLENMVQRIPILREVFTALGIQGDILDAMLEAPVQSGQMLVEALLSSGTAAQESVCNITRLQELLKLPASFDTTALYRAVCLNNATEAVNNLVSNLDIQGLIDGLESPTTMANWSQIFQQSEQLQREVQNLIEHPPSFNASSLISSLERNFNTSDMWQMSSMFNFDQLMGLMDTFPELKMLEGVMRSSGIIVEFLDDMVNRLQIDGVTLDLASLFSSSPSFVRLMDATLHAQPDLFTALTFLQLRPSKANELMGLQPEDLRSTLCTASELEKYVMMPAETNITEIVDVLCSLNFTQFAEELDENFMVSKLTQKLNAAMNSSEPLNLQKYVATYLNFVEHINTLAGVKNVTFDGNDIAKAFDVNMTRLTETLMSLGARLEVDYPALLAGSLESSLAALGNSSEGQAIVYALKVMEAYLHSFNKALKHISSRPISLASIMNNTEVGKIVMPFLQNPYSLEDILNLELLPSKMSALFSSPDVTDVLCGPQLFTAFAAPGNESAVLRHLQTSVCSANATVMMWQAIMGQAGGYQLYQQMELLYQEVAAGRASVNMTAITSDTQTLINMVMQIIQEYQNGTRSTQGLLDWTSFEDIFNRFSKSVGDRLLNMSQQWSSELTAAILPSIPDDSSSSMARTINTMNIFMEIINDRLDDMIKNGVSLQTLLNHSDALVHLMEAYLDLTRLSPQAWLDNHFNMSKVVKVAANETMLNQMCTAKTLAAYLADRYNVTTVTSTIQTVLCSVTTELPQAFTQFIDMQAIETQLNNIWNMSIAVQPEYQRYVDNIDRLNTLITQLATTPPGVDPSLSGRFDFNSMLGSLEDIFTKPEMIFRLLKALGLALDGPLKTNDLENAFYGVEIYVAQPLLALLEGLDSVGVSLSSVMHDPSKMLEALPVLMNFSLQFDLVKSIYLQPKINQFWNNEDFRTKQFCNGSLPAEVFTSVGLQPSVVNTLCSVPQTQWVQTLKGLNATEAQIVAWVDKVEKVYLNVPCYNNTDVSTGAQVEVCPSTGADLLDNKGMYWMRLMTTLESVVSHLMPDKDKGTAANAGESLDRLWTILKDAFFDKTLGSAMNYMELVDRMGQTSETWLVFKQAMKFLQSAGNLLNTGLNKMKDPSGTVYLQNLLPDSQKVADLLTNMLGQASAAEILAASVNPELFYKLAYPDQLQTVACDPVQFSNMFMFPASTNVTAIQVSLCDAINSRSTSVQELIDLFQAGDMLVQLDRLMNGNYSSIAGDTGLWKALHSTVSAMVNNLEQAQSGQFNSTVSMAWLDPVLKQLMSLNQPAVNQVEQMCHNYVAMIGGTQDFQAGKGEVIAFAKVFQIILKTAPFFTKLDDLTCSMVTEKGLDLSAGVNYLKQHGLEALLHSVSDLIVNGTSGEVQCSQMTQMLVEFQTWITNMTQMPEPLDTDRLTQCVERGSAFFADIMQGFNQLYQVLADISSLLGDNDIRAMLQSSGELGQILEFILSVTSNGLPVELQFQDLLKNSTDVQSYLTGIMKLAPKAVESFLASTINLNTSRFLNNTVEKIADILCHPALLAEIVSLPSFSPFNVSQVSTFFCTPEVNVTAAVLKDARKSTEILEQLTGLMMGDGTGQFVSNLTSGIVDLVSQLQSISVLVDFLGNGFDIKFLMENADSIDAIMAGEGSLQKIVNSLVTIVGSLKYVVPPENDYIITDIQIFIRGLIGLDLIQTRLLGAIQVSDLQNDVAAVQQYLIDELDFSPEAATALLSGTYSIRVFLNASGLLVSDEPCEKRLRQFILMNTTQEFEQEITSKFCAFNTTELTDFMEILVPQLDIGSLIQKYISYTGGEFLGTLNMTKSDVQVVFDSLSDGGQTLQEAVVILMSDNSTLGPLLANVGVTADGEFDSLVSLQPALCGIEGSVDDQFNLQNRVQSARTQQDLEEEASLNGEFCKELYRTVKSTQLGSVIWSYLKPIMYGKILYTPDTPLTKEIISDANWVFDTLSEVKRVAKKWSEKAPSLVTLADTTSGVQGLQDNLDSGFVQGILKATLGVDSSRVSKSLDALKNQNMNTSDIKSLQLVAELVYNYTTCLDLSRFEGVADEAELEQRAFKLHENNQFLGGIVFLNVDGDSSSNGRKKRQAGTSNLPEHIMYKIRMDMDNVPTTNRIKDRLWMPHPRDNFASDLRYMRGFVQLQDMVEGAIMRLQTGNDFNDTGVLLQQMPFPCHMEDDYLHFLGSYLLPILMTFAWLAAIGIAAHNLVYDRQNGQEESLRIMGMMSGLNFVAWLVVTVLIMALVSAIITIIFKYANIFHYSNMLIIFLFLLDFCLSTTMMCYLVSSFFSRVTLAILTVLIIYFISFLPYVILVAAEVQLNMWQKTLACLSSTTAFSYGAIFITRFEEEMVGIQWDTMNRNVGDSVDFAWMCYMMLIDSAIYFILGWYIRNVKPGKYGVKQPWYFPVTPSYWCSCLSSSTKMLPPPSNNVATGLNEPAPSDLDIGISVRGLRKSFKGKEDVVHGLNVDVYNDQITTLLGHNGAAKTTTLNMMVGVLSPSAGVVLVEGKKSHGKTGLLGICPQHNTIFEYMTVWEHMEFYAGVKGHLSQLESLREIRKLLHDVDLLHMKDVPAMDLSGGMQRRLCVALAFVGGSRTVVLDEPTSGVDPHARRNIWNLIMKNRPGRTILMSTHHLDEADMLSDRILIMHTGRLLTIGSPAFLKDQLGGGYKLTLNTSPAVEVSNEFEASSSSGSASSEEMTSDHANVLRFVQAKMPAAMFVESVGTDLTIRLPHQGDNSAALYEFFCHLDNQSSDLGVLSYGISNTTLEEVFLKLTSDANVQALDSSSRARSSTTSTDSESVSIASDNTILKPHGASRPKPSVKGASLGFQQLGALLVKRVHHYRRNWRMAFSTLILPLIAFLFAMGFSTLRPVQDDMQNLLMSPALYSSVATESYAFFQDNRGGSAAKHFESMLMADSPGIGTTCMGDYNPGEGFSCVTPGQMHASTKMEQSCHCNDYAYECTEGSQAEGVMQKESIPDVILQNLGLHDADKYLVTSYFQYIAQRYGGMSLEPPSVSGNISTPMAKVWFNNRGYHAIPSYFNALSNNLLRSAVDPADASNYGITLYNHPLMLNKEQLSRESIESGASDVGIAMVVLLALSFIPSAFMVFLTNERISQEQHMQSISGVGTVLYWFASYIWDMFVYCIALGVMVIIVVIFKTDGFYDRENLGAFTLLVFLYGWAVIPLMYSTLRIFKSGSSAYLTLFCLNMLVGLITTIVLFVFSLLYSTDFPVDGAKDVENTAKVLKYVFLIFPQFSLGMGLIELVTNQFQYQLLARFGEDTYVSPYEMDMLGLKFAVLAAQGLVFFIITCIVHSRKERALSMSSGMHYNASKEDEDVFNEQERVRAGGTGDSLAVKELCKVYRRGLKRFCAVNHLSFGVGKGECFGLLGVNGAGKTTTFRMLTGATTASEGDVVIQNKALNQLRSHLSEQIGYCPQENAFDMFMSGRETLCFHAKLRGFSSDEMERAVSEQLKRLQLESHADKPVHTLSGGNKRKLQLAVAMLGDPPLLLLDEPTTGMDAATRRLAWKCITMATHRGQSVVLTSHSMDECDSLCSRLAIMVNGQLKCIGSPQHLKNKFGEGYTVVLHLQGLSNNRYSVAESFMAQFPGSIIKVSLKMKDQHHSVVEVCIPRGAGRVADIFAALQQAQAQHQIMYYSVSQTTLDTVFVNFAREQTDDGDTDPDFDSSSASGGSSSESVGPKPANFHKSLVGGTMYAYMNPEYAGETLDTSKPPLATTPPKEVQGYENKAYDTEFLNTKL